VLSSAWGGEVVLDDAVALHGRTHVHRFHVRRAPAGAPATVIVKRVRDSKERECLQLLTKLSPEPAAPTLYAANESLLVMEDLGDGERLDHTLLGKDPERATQTLVALLETMGSMHAATRGFGKASPRPDPP